MKPIRTPRKPTKFKCIGGWNARSKQPLQLFCVSIMTSIEGWEEYVLARTLDDVNKFVAVHHASTCKGYEPTVKQLTFGLDSIWTID